MHFWFSQPMYSAESSGLRRNIMEAGLTHGLQLPHKSPDGKPEGTTLPWSPRTMCPAQRVCGRPLWLSSPSRAASGSETISVEFWSNDIQRKPTQAGRGVFPLAWEKMMVNWRLSRRDKTCRTAATSLQKLSGSLRIMALEWNFSSPTVVIRRQAAYKNIRAFTDF